MSAPALLTRADPPPAHVLVAFGLSADLEPLSAGVYRAGEVVLKAVTDPAEAAFLAGTLESLPVPALRLARPVRSSDGRWVVGGWSAQRFVTGRPEPRYDEIVEASVELHRAFARTPEPRFLRARHDLYACADRLAWGEDAGEVSLGEGAAAEVFAELAAGRRVVDLRAQLVHGDLYANVLFAGSAPPAVIDLTPYWRPASWAAAVIAVDALSWGGAGTDLVETWDSLPQWRQMLRRALLFRLAVSLLHPRTTPSSLVEILSAAVVLRPFLD